jgi:hypothetical protein
MLPQNGGPDYIKDNLATVKNFGWHLRCGIGTLHHGTSKGSRAIIKNTESSAVVPALGARIDFARKPGSAGDP